MGSSFKTSRRHVIRAATGIGAVTGLALTGLVYLPAASAAVPVFPNNVVVFPDRDFVSVEGYAEHAGETATIEVSRPGTGVMGSAKAVVSGTDVAFEVNHPGGICWGAGTSLDVTPDIKAGDIVKVTFPDGSHDETTTSSATVTKDMVQNGTTITVEGSIGSDVNPDFIEQRIINPDLVALVGKRDIRALPGPIVPAARGGYSSGLTFPTPTTFLATYQFDTLEAADAAAAADLGERAMNWQVQDADGNRQGLTIAEFGEAGGPGMGGCPQGPGNQGAPGGSARDCGAIFRSATAGAGGGEVCFPRESTRPRWSAAGASDSAAYQRRSCGSAAPGRIQARSYAWTSCGRSSPTRPGWWRGDSSTSTASTGRGCATRSPLAAGWSGRHW